MQSLEERIADIKARVAALEDAMSPEYHSPTTENADIDGTVTFAGSVRLPTGNYKYKWIRPTAEITDEPWDAAMNRIAALAHPVRGAMLRHLLCAPASVADLVDSELVSSTGTAYHHLKELQAAGWVTKRDGLFEIPPARIIPLMSIVIAAEDH